MKEEGRRRDENWGLGVRNIGGEMGVYCPPLKEMMEIRE